MKRVKPAGCTLIAQGKTRAGVAVFQCSCCGKRFEAPRLPVRCPSCLQRIYY